MAQYSLPLIEGHTATPHELGEVERHLGVTLPAKYKSFMLRYGGGMFGFIDLFPVLGRGRSGDDVTSVNDRVRRLGQRVGPVRGPGYRRRGGHSAER
jgi:hypothetical protein